MINTNPAQASAGRAQARTRRRANPYACNKCGSASLAAKSDPQGWCPWCRAKVGTTPAAATDSDVYESCNQHPGAADVTDAEWVSGRKYCTDCQTWRTTAGGAL